MAQKTKQLEIESRDAKPLLDHAKTSEVALIGVASLSVDLIYHRRLCLCASGFLQFLSVVIAPIILSGPSSTVPKPDPSFNRNPRLSTMLVLAPLLLALPAIATAQEQKPLGQSLLDKVKSYIPGLAQEPVAAGAAKVAAANVTPLTNSNWEEVLSPKTTSPGQGPETWMVFVSGGNKTCYGRCAKVEEAWNETAALFAADPTAPHLAYINCDKQTVLCSTWAAAAPTIWHIQRPIAQADQSTPATTIHIVPLNTTTTTAQKIVQIHTQKTYEKRPVYEGAFHPFDGYLAKWYLNKPAGYAIFAFSQIPSWAFMIGISMFSRNMM